jgi:hypothetical protein
MKNSKSKKTEALSKTHKKQYGGDSPNFNQGVLKEHNVTAKQADSNMWKILNDTAFGLFLKLMKEVYNSTLSKDSPQRITNVDFQNTTLTLNGNPIALGGVNESDKKLSYSETRRTLGDVEKSKLIFNSDEPDAFIFFVFKFVLYLLLRYSYNSNPAIGKFGYMVSPNFKDNKSYKDTYYFSSESSINQNSIIYNLLKLLKAKPNKSFSSLFRKETNVVILQLVNQDVTQFTDEFGTTKINVKDKEVELKVIADHFVTSTYGFRGVQNSMVQLGILEAQCVLLTDAVISTPAWRYYSDEIFRKNRFLLDKENEEIKILAYGISIDDFDTEFTFDINDSLNKLFAEKVKHELKGGKKKRGGGSSTLSNWDEELAKSNIPKEVFWLTLLFKNYLKGAKEPIDQEEKLENTEYLVNYLAHKINAPRIDDGKKTQLRELYEVCKNYDLEITKKISDLTKQIAQSRDDIYVNKVTKPVLEQKLTELKGDLRKNSDFVATVLLIYDIVTYFIEKCEGSSQDVQVSIGFPPERNVKDHLNMIVSSLNEIPATQDTKPETWDNDLLAKLNSAISGNSQEEMPFNLFGDYSGLAKNKSKVCEVLGNNNLNISEDEFVKYISQNERPNDILQNSKYSDTLSKIDYETVKNGVYKKMFTSEAYNEKDKYKLFSSTAGNDSYNTYNVEIYVLLKGYHSFRKTPNVLKSITGCEHAFLVVYTKEADMFSVVCTVLKKTVELQSSKTNFNNELFFADMKQRFDTLTLYNPQDELLQKYKKDVMSPFLMVGVEGYKILLGLIGKQTVKRCAPDIIMKHRQEHNLYMKLLEEYGLSIKDTTQKSVAEIKAEVQKIVIESKAEGTIPSELTVLANKLKAVAEKLTFDDLDRTPEIQEDEDGIQTVDFKWLLMPENTEKINKNLVLLQINRLLRNYGIKYDNKKYEYVQIKRTIYNWLYYIEDFPSYLEKQDPTAKQAFIKYKMIVGTKFLKIDDVKSINLQKIEKGVLDQIDSFIDSLNKLNTLVGADGKITSTDGRQYAIVKYINSFFKDDLFKKMLNIDIEYFFIDMKFTMENIKTAFINCTRDNKPSTVWLWGNKDFTNVHDTKRAGICKDTVNIDYYNKYIKELDKLSTPPSSAGGKKKTLRQKRALRN